MDTQLRKLHRAAKQGDSEDKARYVAELVRNGLPMRRVYLAGRLGNEEAELLGTARWDFTEGQDWSDIFYRAIRELSGEETQEFLRQWLLQERVAIGFLPEDRKWLKKYLKKGIYPKNLTRVADIYHAYMPSLGVLVWYWYQPCQFRVDDDLLVACGELSRALASSRDGAVQAHADALGRFLLYGNIGGP